MPLFWAAGIAAAGTIGASVIGSNAASDAANATGAASAAATAEQAREFNTGIARSTPAITTGTSALNRLAQIYGLDSYTPAPPGSAGSATGASGATGGDLSPGMLAAQQAAGTRGGGGTDWGSAIATGFLGARKNNSPIQDISQAIAAGTPITDSQWAQAGYGPGGSAPGTQAGSAGTPGTAGGTFTPGSAQPKLDPNATFYQSPDYQFRLSQGQKALEARAATGVFGGLDSGALRKAEIEYGGNIASGDFNNYANRLSALAGVGQTAVTNANSLGANYATSVGNIAQNQGNNNANASLFGASSYGNAIGGLAGIGAGLASNGAFSSNSGYATYNPSTQAYIPGPQGFA